MWVKAFEAGLESWEHAPVWWWVSDKEIDCWVQTNKHIGFGELVLTPPWVKHDTDGTRFYGARVAGGANRKFRISRGISTAGGS